MRQLTCVFAGFMFGLLCLISTVAGADTTDLSVWRNLPLVPITFRPEAGIRFSYDLPPLGKYLLKPVPEPSDKLLKFVGLGLFPSGIAVTSSSTNPDPLIPAPGMWIRLSDNSSGVTGANQGGFVSRVADPTMLCVNVDGGNPTACQNNAAGDAQITANGSGTSLTITAIPGGSPTQVVTAGAVVSDGGLNIKPGTYIVTPVTGQNPLISSSACLPSCTVTLNKAVSNTFTGATVTVNPATYQSSTIASQFSCSLWSNLAPYSAPAIDPATGRVWYPFPGGHSSNCNAVGVMEFDPLVAVENKQGPSFNGDVSGNTLTVDALNGGSLSGFDSIQVGQSISGDGFTTATITAFRTGTGGPGTYTFSGSPQTVSGVHFTATNPNFVSGWNQVVMPARFQSTAIYPQPGWANQQLVSTPMSDYYLAPNYYGMYTWQSTHTYQAPGAANGFVTGAGTFAFNVETAIGSGYFVDSNYQNIPIGPIVIPNNSSAGYTFNGLAFGYAQQNPGTNASVLAAWGFDKNLYSVGVDASDNFQGVYLANPFPVYQNGVPLSSSTWNVGAKTGTACFPDYGPAVIIDDQIDGGTTKLLAERSLSPTVSPVACTPTISQLQTAGNINSGDAGTLRTITLSGTSPFSTNCGGSGCGVCTSEAFCGIACTYDSIHKLIYCTDGSRGIEVITPNATTTWTVATASNSTTGSPPPDPTSGICAASVNSGPALQFMDQNGAGFLEFAKCGDVWRLGLYDNGCPSPTADGTVLTGGVGRQCFLTDSSGNSWQLSSSAFPPSGITSRPIFNVQEQPSGMMGFTGVTLTIPGGQPASVPFNGVELELKGGLVYLLQQNEALQRWVNMAGLQVTGPGGSTTGPVAAIGATQYNFPASVDYNVTSGQTINILSPSVQYLQSGGFEGAIIISPNFNSGTHMISGVRLQGSGVPLYAAHDNYNEAIVNNYSGDNTTIDNLELGFHHDLEFADAGDCVHEVNNNTNIMLIQMFAHDCDNGVHTGGQNGVIVENNVITSHNGGDGGDGSATHGQYLSVNPFSQPNDPTTAVVNGGGSYCERNVDRLPVAGTTGFPFKERFGVFQMYNFTIAEPDFQNLYSDCQQLGAFDPTCGGALTLGAPDQSSTPATVTSVSTTATVTLGSVTATAFTYTGATGEVDATVPATNFLPGVRFLVSGVTGGSGSTSALAGDWASSVGSGTTLTYYIQTGLTITGSITATIQYELPYNVGTQFLATMAGFTPSGYNATQTVATVTSLTTFTYVLGGSLGVVTGMGTFTVPGGVVFEAGPDYESTPYSIIDYGDNLNNIEGDCAFKTATINATGSSYTSGTGVTTIQMTTTAPAGITGPFATITSITGVGSDCSSSNFVGVQLSIGMIPTGNTFSFTTATGLNCTSITGGTVYFPGHYATNSVTLNNCIMMNDSGETISSNGVEAVVVRDVRSVAPTTTLTNCVVIDPRAANLAAAMGVSYTDGGGNHFYHTRFEAAQAGVKFPGGNYKYPSIPYVQ